MKTVVVIDMPEFCAKCPLLHLGNRYVCSATNRWCGDEKGYYTSEMKPTWCPLKDLPQKIEGKREKFMPTYSLGWNDCLDAIELGLKPLWEKQNER